MLGSRTCVRLLNVLLMETKGGRGEQSKPSGGFKWYHITVITVCHCQNLQRALGKSFNSNSYSMPLSRQSMQKQTQKLLPSGSLLMSVKRWPLD